MNSRGPIPAYTEPAFYKQLDDSFEPGENTTHTLNVRPDPTKPEETVEFDVDDETFNVLMVRFDSWPSAKGFWTAIHYLRDYGVHGCWKERLQVDGVAYRLGAFYCIAPIELNERETNYNKYGESPYEP